MARLVLHIGMDKTGTSYLQNTLAANVDRLPELAIGFPKFSPRAPHIDWSITTSHDVDACLQHGVDPGAALEQLDLDVDAELARVASQYPTSISSSEFLSVCLAPEQIARLRERLARFFDVVDIVFFIRRQDYFVSSWYAQWVRSGATQPQPPQLAEIGHRLHPLWVTKAWQEQFGVANVHAFPYLERAKSDPGAVLNQCLALAMNDVPANAAHATRTWSLPAGPINASLSARAVEVVRILNPEVPIRHPDGRLRLEQRRRFIEVVSKQFPGSAFSLNSESMQAVHDQLMIDNVELFDIVTRTPGWDEWLAQAAAPTVEVVEPSAAELESVMTAYRVRAAEPAANDASSQLSVIGRAKRAATRLVRTVR